MGLLENLQKNIGPIKGLLSDLIPKDVSAPDRGDTIAKTVAFLTRPDVEGFIPRAKVLKGEKKLTIGHGITGPEFKRLTGRQLKKGDSISEAESASLVAKIVKEKQPFVEGIARRAAKKGLTLGPNQKAAITSTIFNVGQGAFSRSMALKKIIKGDRDGFLSEAFGAKEGFVNQGGRRLKGLQNRRKREEQLFITPSKPISGFLGFGGDQNLFK